MNTEPYGTTVFCDDIRHEINGKLTLVGCYANELLFSNPAPALLPNFAALINIRIPQAHAPKAVKVVVVKDEANAEIEIFSTEIDLSNSQKEVVKDDERFNKGEPKVISLILPVQWSPLEILDDAVIKVRAYLDGGHEIRLGVLRIVFPAKTQDPVS